MSPQNPPPPFADRARGALLGLAAGDAVGTTVEFKPRGTFEPLTDMVGGGPFGLPRGAWTDDTSMALCLGISLLESDGFDPRDQMQRYVRWMDEGYQSSIGHCFDIGNATAAALRRFKQTQEPYSGATDAHSAGNGSIMRLAPIPIYYHADRAAVVKYSGESSRTTHGAVEAVDACRLFGLILHRALSGHTKEEILFSPEDSVLPFESLAPKVLAIAQGEYRHKSTESIQGTGYVIPSLEAALWAFWTTDTYRDAILAAVNLGDDADTTGAVCGQIAGAYYGYSAIPENWRSWLVKHDELLDLADGLADDLAA